MFSKTGELAGSCKVWIFMLILLCGFAAVDFVLFANVRRTFVFYELDSGRQLVEERMLSRSNSQETAILRYVRDMILGPSTMEAAALINQGTVVNSLLLRNSDGIRCVYLDLSEQAAVPPPEGGEVLHNLEIVKECIHRNFMFVKEVKIFINGNEIDR
ncbi:MAG: hypothetical protein Ta2B_02010 [Termitinemataceae bacterium]|nr:MAG: hypothetical protein Ta2B_02010 [Termitinemataceae bacterium]